MKTKHQYNDPQQFTFSYLPVNLQLTTPPIFVKTQLGDSIYCAPVSIHLPTHKIYSAVSSIYRLGKNKFIKHGHPA